MDLKTQVLGNGHHQLVVAGGVSLNEHQLGTKIKYKTYFPRTNQGIGKLLTFQLMNEK